MKFLNFSHHDSTPHIGWHTRPIGPKRSNWIRHREAFLDTRPSRRLRPSDRYCHRMRYARGYGADDGEVRFGAVRCMSHGTRGKQSKSRNSETAPKLFERWISRKGT